MKTNQEAQLAGRRLSQLSESVFAAGSKCGRGECD